MLAAMPVVVDLSEVRFLTSAGIVALLSERSFGRPALYCPDGSVAARMLEIVQAQLGGQTATEPARAAVRSR